MVVHRLDQGTSGLVVFAKHEAALKSLHAQLREKAAAAAAAGEAGGGSTVIEKGYTALVSCSRGPLDPAEGKITLAIRKDKETPPKQVCFGWFSSFPCRGCIQPPPDAYMTGSQHLNLRWWTWSLASRVSPCTASVDAAPIGASSGCSR